MIFSWALRIWEISEKRIDLFTPSLSRLFRVQRVNVYEQGNVYIIVNKADVFGSQVKGS